MSTSILIHVEWEGPHSWDDLPKLDQQATDYGVYQVYGGHPVYGGSSLLYIGMACDQTFGKRLSQEQWWRYNRNAGHLEIHVGRLAGKLQPDNDAWSQQIKLAERLLIASHYPPFNAQKKPGRSGPGFVGCSRPKLGKPSGSDARSVRAKMEQPT